MAFFWLDRQFLLCLSNLTKSFYMFLFVGGGFRLQVDDNHRLYVDGVQKSVGNQWNRVYSIAVKATSSVALFAENIVRNKTLMINVDLYKITLERIKHSFVALSDLVLVLSQIKRNKGTTGMGIDVHNTFNLIITG